MHKRFARAAGGGRKREFSREISQLGERLQKERSDSHNVSKNELLKEFLALCRHEMQRKAWLKEADRALQRKTKLQQSSKYAASYVEKLIQWLGAAYLSKDQTTRLARVEEQVRAQLTFQDIDRKLWHLGAAPVAELEDAHLVADAEMIAENRSSLVIGTSDQVPLWAKAPSKKLVFSAEAA